MVEPDRPFRLRPRAPKRADDNSRGWPAALRRVLQLVQTTSKSVSRSRRQREAATVRTGARSFTQRCAVRVTYSLNRTKGQWAAHGRYVARESAAGQTRAEANGFDAKSDLANIAQTAANWQSSRDPRMFKMIL